MTRQPARLPSFADEDERVEARRQMLGAVVEPHAPVFALALSGGGIRSATFALGVMQGLNDVPVPARNAAIALASTAEEIASDSPRAAPGSPPESRFSNLLARFDYLSTVSGGGYAGSFFCSLFVPERLDIAATDNPQVRNASLEAARLAYKVMSDEPPGRMRIEATSGGASLYQQPLAWLRENGRYLAPTGAGDMLYAGALAIRNWLAIQYVLATVIVAALAFLMLIRTALVVYGGLASMASSLIWAIGVAIVALWSFPVGIAFWLAQARAHEADAAVTRAPSLAGWGDLALGLVLTALSAALLISGLFPRADAFGIFFLGIGSQALIGFVAYEASRHGRSVTEHRVILTRNLALSFKFIAFVFVFALADTLARYAYNELLANRGDLTRPASLSALLAAVIWGVRHLSLLFDQKSDSGWWRKLPVDLVAGVLAFVIALALIVIWAVLIDWMVWNGGPASPGTLDRTSVVLLLLIVGVTAMMAWVVGQFPAFINLSSLQSIYSARLTRAYLGASNGDRLAARMQSEGTKAYQGGSVAEPLPSDQLTHEAYYARDVLAPLHIINVTINQTTDSNEQLVQRDRKGLPLAVLPTGFTVDGKYAALERDLETRSIERPLTIGQWVGTSGAAVATGLGHITTRGLSLLLGLANMRLGMWWQSGQGTTERSLLEQAFATQSYLLSELTAQFHGLRRRWQYLSDGGHFDNTGIYELLRPARRVQLIVACDNGADVDGRFDDLANLVRLARIDFGLELEINQKICKEPELGHLFGRPEDLVRKAGPEMRAEKRAEKCAMLIDVFFTDPATQRRERRCRIVVLKPRVIEGTPLDVLQYAAAHPTFPNESTAQQFFDEAQWESYRRLGVTIGRVVFGLGDDAAIGTSDALWRFLRI